MEINFNLEGKRRAIIFKHSTVHQGSEYTFNQLYRFTHTHFLKIEEVKEENNGIHGEIKNNCNNKLTPTLASTTKSIKQPITITL